MDKRILDLVRRRAADTCEYCKMPQTYEAARFQIDHIIAQQHGGDSSFENLAMCCIRCNLHKGPNIAGIDPVRGQFAPLFNPRTQEWRTHFAWDGAVVVGLTPAGRATIAVLAMNRIDAVAARKALIAEGCFPPMGSR